MRVLAVTNMFPTQDTPAFGTFVGSQVDSLRHEGVEVDVLFIDGRRNTVNYLWGIPRLWVRLLTHRYDLIHAHYVFSGIIARAQFLYPVVLTHHGVEVLRGWQSVLCRIVSPLADHVIVTSQEMKEKLGGNRVAVIPCGIDLNLFRPLPQQECRRSLSLPMDKRLILFAGRYLSSEKRFDIVQKAMRQLRQRMPDAELILAADEPHSAMPAYMNACDVLLLASDAEGSPMVVKEAMACNLPIVSVAVGDVPDVIDGTEGCYICPQDSRIISRKLELALGRGMRTSGRSEVQRFELAATSERIVGVYEKALAGGKGRLVVRGWLKGPTSYK